jgi:hypothetical protein
MPESYSFTPQFATIRSESPLAGMRPVKAIHTALQFQPQKFLEVKSEQPELVSNAWASGLKEGIGDALKGITAAFVDERKAKRQEKKENLDRFARIIVAQARGSKGAEDEEFQKEYKAAQLENLKSSIEARKNKKEDDDEEVDYGSLDEPTSMDATEVPEGNLPDDTIQLFPEDFNSDTSLPIDDLNGTLFAPIGPTQQEVGSLWNKPLSELTANVDIQKQAGALADMQAGNLTPTGASMSTDTQAPEKPASFNILSKNKSLVSPEEARRLQEEFYATTRELPTGFDALSTLPKPEQQQVLAGPKVDEQDLNRYFRTWGDPNVAIKAQKKIAEILGPEYNEAKIEQIKTKKGETGFKILFPEKKTIDQLKKEKEALNPQPGMSKDQIGVYDKLYANVQQNPLIKNAIDAKSSSDIILSSLAEKNGFGDINAINAFQRMVDPGVAVREGDVSLLQSAMPRLRRMGLTVANLIEGDKLTPEARDQLKILAKKIANTRISSAKQPISDLRQIAIDSGINPDRVIRELTIEVEPQENLANSAKQKFMQMKEMPEGEEKEQLKKELKVLVEQLRATQKK